MRILYLTQVLPYPLDAGPKVRAYYTLRHLALRHEVTLLSFVRESDTPEAIGHLKSICAGVRTVPIRRSRIRDAFHMLGSLATRRPFLIVRDWRPAMAAEIRRVLSSSTSFDAIHADQLWMAPFALLARETVSPHARIVLDQHNAVYQIPLRLAESETNPLKRCLLMREARRMADYEVRSCARFDRVVFVTEEDRAALFTRGLNDRPGRDRVIPISIQPPGASPSPRRARPHRITFMGGLHWPPNRQGAKWFEASVWPRVIESVPEAVFTVIGKDPSTPAHAGCSRSVEHLGYVDDPNPYLEETAAFVVPLFAGGGMRVKILDAWACGLPVISTTIGAEGIRAVPGRNMLLADDEASFAAAVVRVLRDPELAARIANGGRETVEEHYNWQHAYQAWDEVYR